MPCIVEAFEWGKNDTVGQVLNGRLSREDGIKALSGAYSGCGTTYSIYTIGNQLPRLIAKRVGLGIK